MIGTKAVIKKRGIILKFFFEFLKIITVAQT
ncbi:hypothetical protein FIC_02351 [Flavobacteriaceae bacterium 3519-10]|nr:hypothetical protein FIC_02351 [Flavobacteriaceae bacterium 3519-10]